MLTRSLGHNMLELQPQNEVDMRVIAQSFSVLKHAVDTGIYSLDGGWLKRFWDRRALNRLQRESAGAFAMAAFVQLATGVDDTYSPPLHLSPKQDMRLLREGARLLLEREEAAEDYRRENWLEAEIPHTYGPKFMPSLRELNLTFNTYH